MGANKLVEAFLQKRIEHWRDMHKDQLDVPLTPLVCTDLWYLNHTDLQRRPTICIGGPGVNALAAINANQSEDEEGFEPEPGQSVNEQLLEAIQQAWIEEKADAAGDDADDDDEGGYSPNQPFR